MQPPPQAAPPGVGGPPPPLATSQNMYWRSGPFGRRAATQGSLAAGPVQPVTDPFAFGRQAPQGSTAKGNPPVMQGFSPMEYPPATVAHLPPPHAGDNSHGLHPSLLAPAYQSGTHNTSSDMAVPLSSLPTHVTNNGAEMHPNVDFGIAHPAGQSHATRTTLENAVSRHEGLVSAPDRPLGEQDVYRNPSDPSLVPMSSSLFPPVQQTVPQWKSAQGSFQPQGPAYSPYSDPPSQNAFYAVTQSAVGISQLGPHQSPPQQADAPNTMQAPLMPSVTRAHSAAQNTAWPNTVMANPCPSQFPQEHFYLQPLETNCDLGHPSTQENNSSARPHDMSEATSRQCPAATDSGTISMFFKGDEAENEEILSSDKTDQASKGNFDSFQQTMGHTYYQPLHPQQIPAATSSQAQANTTLAAESLQKGVDAPHPPRPVCEQRDPQVHKNAAFLSDDKAGLAGARGHVGPPYENVENLEYVQNQEVLPSEPSAHNRSSPSAVSDSYRYASLPGPLPPKNNAVSHLEGGPNLEAPDSLPRPVRPDSVSSNYSNLSHRSISSSTRPQEHGTFIQQESGKPEEGSSAGFFMQIDSSPLGPASEQSLSKNYHGGVPHAPTPSPPKPMGVFQTSANSSFEPVRSQGLGAKPAEVDQAKMVVELRESHPPQRSTKKNPVVPVASPGNLEQPPDNLETIFLPQDHPLPLTAADHAGNVLVPGGGSVRENVQAVPEKRPLTKAQGSLKKCESPVTTLWAHNELPNFGGNVLLAPAAPAVYVPAKQTLQVVQPPDEGQPEQQPSKAGATVLPPPPQTANAPSENLENPPKMRDEETLHSQASSGYASLLSSPPTEALQTQPILIAQPNQSSALAQPINFSLANQPIKNDNKHIAEDPAIGSKPLLGSSNLSGNNVPLPAVSAGTLVHPPAAAVTYSNLLQGPPSASEMLLTTSASLLVHPASQVPLNLAREGQQATSLEGPLPNFASKPGPNVSGSHSNASVALTPPAGATVPNSSNQSRAKMGSSCQEPSRVLDFTVAKALEQSGAGSCTQAHNYLLPSSLGLPHSANHASHMEPGPHVQQHFYQQVTKDMQPPGRSDRGALQQQMQAVSSAQAMLPQQPSVPLNHQGPPGRSPALAPSQRPCPAVPPEETSAQPPASYGQIPADNKPLSSGPSASAPAAVGPPPASASASTSQPAGLPLQQELQHSQPSQTPQNAFGPPPPPPPNPYYYYRHPYDAYPSSYQLPYPPVDPRTAHLYYQEDAYGRYNSNYQQYGNSTAYVNPGDYRYTEPERPSSRASHTSDRTPSRQGYPDDYYNTKSGWGDYYSSYYANPYDYADPSRSDRYQSAYDARFRDPRVYDQRYWCDAEQNSYQKREPYGNSHSRYDPWQYDPRFAGSFDDDLEPRRDPYGEDFDRRSVHSEHSGHSVRSSHSVHSRQSSFSSRSQQSQLYRSNHDLTATAYEAAHQPASLHTEYSYEGYTNFDSQPPFTDYSYSAHTGWPATEQVPSRPLTPEKFSVPHVCTRFGPGGYLIKVLPNLPSEGQPALVEIHSMEVVMQHSPEQEEMRAFPGPLTKDDTHKVDVINFAQNKATRCFQNEALIDKESARLLWDFVVLLCRQNGTVVGTDIADLLLRDHKTVWLPGKSPNEANLIDFTNEALEQVEEESGEAQLSFLTDSLIATIGSLEKETERFRELLLYGRKKDALESAMKHGLWGHALLLASKMDSRTHARVMTRFANSLPINDPLQTVYQLMSGRMPAASTCCGDEKWGDWRPHLAMVLSNLTNNMDVESRTITTMGDTLASKGLLDAAHFCYLMAQVGFGVYTKKMTKLVLIGSNHSLPFFKFATSEAIQRTEAYEYAQSLGTQPRCLPNFQVFKFIYACRLAEVGLAAQAFHYCEVISKVILRSPCYYSPVLIGQLIQMSSQLRLFDPQIKEKPEQEIFIEPDWLVQLRNLDGQMKEDSVPYSAGRWTPHQYLCSTPSSELDHISQNEGIGAGLEVNSSPDNPLLASALPLQSVQLMPSAPQAILDSSAAMTPPSQQESFGTVPFYPVTPPPSGPGPGFPNAHGVEHAPSYVGSVLPPPPSDLQPQQQVNQEAALQPVPQASPVWKAASEPREDDFYQTMATMGPGRRSRSTPQSSAHMGPGRRSRTTSESSVHSIGRERRNSAANQPSPPPPSIPEGKETKKESKKEAAPRKSGTTWLSWLLPKGKNEAHLPDDKNKSIVWDEKKQRWVNLDEPEEESKPPPPPPMGFPQVPQAAPPGPGGPPNASINMFSRRAAGSRARYVDILNPSGAKVLGVAPAPSDLFAPLAPMPIPANLLVPNPALEEQQQPLEGKLAEEQVAPGSQTTPATTADLPYLNSATFPPSSELPPPNLDGSQSGELSRSSSMSSLSREVSQHFNQPPLGGPPAGTVQFYNPSQFAQSAAAPGGSRLGRIGQRKYPTLK